MFNGLILIAGLGEGSWLFNKKYNMKKIEITILLLGLFIGGLCGYIIGHTGKLKEKAIFCKDPIAEMQRDRLSDYIRIYEDIQAEEGSPTPKLREVINDLEKEDNTDKNLGFKMNLDNWAFAY